MLEIGCCGAITGALCEKAEKVTVLSCQKRSEINAWRHKDCENLTILMGNFQEIDLRWRRSMITLLWSFWVWEKLYSERHPYVDFLKTIARHLKPGGQIVLAIETVLDWNTGLAVQRITLEPWGLEGYPTTKGVNLYQKELRNSGKSRKSESAVVLSVSGLQASHDHIFWQASLKGELNRMETNFDRLRLQLSGISCLRFASGQHNDMLRRQSFPFCFWSEKSRSVRRLCVSSFPMSGTRLPWTDICELEGLR